MSNLQELLDKYDKVAVAGAPKTGKTTLVQSVRADRPILHTDDYISGRTWDEQLDALMAAVEGLDRFLVEGVQVPRMLRKGMVVDAVFELTNEPFLHLSPGQRRLASTMRKILREWGEVTCESH
jgi:hypothetical protein